MHWSQILAAAALCLVCSALLFAVSPDPTSRLLETRPPPVQGSESTATPRDVHTSPASGRLSHNAAANATNHDVTPTQMETTATIRADTATTAPPRRGGIRWTGAECHAPDVRTARFLRYGCKNPHFASMGYCSAKYDGVGARGEAHKCTFWSRVRYSAPNTASRYDEARQSWLLREKKGHVGKGAQRLCSVGDIVGVGLPRGDGTGRLEFVPHADGLRLRVQGCRLDESILDSSDRLIGILRAASDGGRRPIVISGDSMMRQLFMRLVMSLRGPSNATSPTQVWIGPSSKTCWCDMVYVVRRHDDEVSIVDFARTHYDGVRTRVARRLFPHQDEVNTFCWRPSDPKREFRQPRGPDVAPNSSVQCVRKLDETLGPVWCDPDDVENPCLLRVHFVWSGHEGFFQEDDLGRAQEGIYTSRQSGTAVADYMAKHVNHSGSLGRSWRGPEAAVCRVDCAPNRTAVIDRLSVTDVPVAEAETELSMRPDVPPMELAYDDVPAVHIAANNYWVTQRVNAGTDLGRSYMERVTQRFIELLSSFFSRLMDAKSCSASSGKHCESPLPSYRMIWLTTPQLRPGGGRNLTFNPLVALRNERMRSWWTQRAGQESAAAVDLVDIATMFDGAPAANVTGVDGLHLMCTYRLTLYRKGIKHAVEGDRDGCRGPLDGAVLKLLFHALVT